MCAMFSTSKLHTSARDVLSKIRTPVLICTSAVALRPPSSSTAQIEPTQQQKHAISHSTYSRHIARHVVCSRSGILHLQGIAKHIGTGFNCHAECKQHLNFKSELTQIQVQKSGNAAGADRLHTNCTIYLLKVLHGYRESGLILPRF